MAEFKISRIRYTWRNTWAVSTAYNKDDVVRYGGSAWVCIRQHTASAFATDQTYLANPSATEPSPAWIKMADGIAWRGDWVSSRLYNPGDIALYGGVIYLCVTSHSSLSEFSTNSNKWTVYASLYNWRTDWTQNTRYGVGDIAKYNGIVYRAIAEHTSSPTFGGLEVERGHWTVVNEGVEFVGTWATGQRYRANDLVKYGGTIWRCKEGHTSGADSTLNFDGEEHWDIEFPGFQKSGEWVGSTVYQIGDVVQHGGYIYYSLTNNYNSNPSNSIYQVEDRINPIDWKILTKATNLRGDWESTATYKTGDVVRRGGYLYIAILDSTDDGSSLDYLDTSNWEIVVPGDKWQSSWISATAYSIGDIVTFEGTAWRSNYDHVASNDNYPALDSGSGFAYWDIVLLAGTNVGMSARGDLLTYDLSRSLAGDGSTFNETSIPIGNPGEVLAVDNETSLYYKVWGNAGRVRYVSSDDSVALDDITDPMRGVNPFKPWRTVRFACEQVEAEGTTVEETTIIVRTGYYEEVLPIIVPAKVAIVGEELRAVTIVAKPAIPELDVDASYSIAAIDRISDIIQDVFAGRIITKTSGNTQDQVVLTSSRQVPRVPPQFDTDTGLQIFDTVTGPIEVAPGGPSFVQNLILDIIDYINSEVNSIGSTPTVTGSNTLRTESGYINASLILEANKDFLAAEARAFISTTYPAYNFDPASCERDIRAYIDAFKYDILYPGNYKSLLAARYYRNAVLGSQGEDMFYVRDATGIRNMTLKGLSGELNPPNVFELYQRPTGGAFVSLDPGWGPDDTRVWITTRSCYVQNVTTFGNNATGQKIDGALHNGGNKSIVSNDFTQVISDGIGAWALNNGRAELVSVFTYYSQIGMFSEAGGVIRATNGNSSYGTFGAISQGNDPTEVPQYAEVNTRSGQALIASAFAGEINDEILLLEFSNAGEQYTTAGYTFVGSGTNASVVQEEFRDFSIFEMMIKKPPGITAGSAGGGGYSLIGNNVQTGTTTSITLATNDNNEEPNLLGLRVVITSGDGTGQYGYVTAYNSATKILNVSRESDDQPGWDHIVPGTPSVVIMTTNATYRFEPRITFAAPPYAAASVDLGISTSWSNAVYSETIDTYSNITGAVGSGTTIDVVPFAATWNITKVGREYVVTLVQGGAGYAVDQIITIDGADAGGITGENDIAITVHSVTDDSTNSIVNVTWEGIAQSGRFVVIPDNGNTARTSLDGTTWEASTLPTSGTWKCLAAGNNKFVAIRYNSALAGLSTNGVDWSSVSMPALANWNSVAYGNGVFVAIAGNGDIGAFSTDGLVWTATTLPDIGDSTFSEWVDITYGKQRFVAVANNGNFAAVGTYNSSTNTISWTAYTMDVIADSTTKDWTSVSYGNQRFVAVSGTGEVGYSFDGAMWYPATMPTQDGSTAHFWRQIRYGQGVFFAVGTTGSRLVGGDETLAMTSFAATSYDGVVWTTRTLATSSEWVAVAFGNPDISLGDSTFSNSRPMWIVVSSSSTNTANKIYAGAKAIGRAIIESGRLSEVKIWEPGSGYYDGSPAYTITDPNNTSEAYINLRIGNGVLAQPSWINRGNNYKTSSTFVTITGDGYADVIPSGQFVIIKSLQVIPGPGAQFRFRGESGYYTVATVEVESSQIDGTSTALFRISPTIDYDYYLENGSQVEIRNRYSQVRITGHDFLDVGSGNFIETNYPELYETTSATYPTAPENEIFEADGGRVFYTATDQSGNFRTGELFAVEQATGVVTISADFFDLQGLTELALGGVRLGGSGAVIREFSTDPLFTADSNNVVPTQRAIKAYLQNRLNVGGSDLLTASFIAGTVRVGPNFIGNTASLTVTIPVIANFDGTGPQIGGNPARIGLSGSWVAQNMFYRSFRD